MNIFGKRIISLALALLMAFGTAPAAFAIELEEIAGENPVLEERENEIPAEETKQSYEGVSLEYENEELLSAGETEHNHSYAANVTTPTCTERGYTTYICDCGERYVADYVAARGHDYADEKCLHCGSSWPEKLLHFSFDDTIGALKDLTENANKYQSLFDQPFFKALKDLHDTYGAVFSLYCFYNLVDSTDKTTVLFSLEDCTDRYSEEFSQNVGWLRLGFHSVDNLTNYANAKAAEAKIDYDRMIDQILRITGTEKSVDTCVRLQNFAGNLASCQAMRDCEYGVIGLLTSDYAEASSSDVYYTSGYYLKEPATTMIASKGEYYDTSEGLVFYPSNLRLDNISSTAVLAYMDTFLSKEKNDRNKIIIMYAHENQMYKNGQVNSDYIKRLSIVCDWALENEYKFAFPMDRVIKTEELPEENTPNDVNVRTFTNKGYLSVTDGAVTKPESTWVHSELLSLEDITNDSTGICAYKFIGHAYVANIAYYADSDFSTWISSLGSTTGFSGTPTVTAEFVRQNAPEDAKYVAFSTNGESDTLAVSLKAPSTTTNSFDITDKTSAAAYLRSKMIAREPSITIRLNGEVTSSDVSAILAEAWKHTGVPNEGDYIRHNQIGYDYTFTAGEDADGAYTEITYTFNWLTTAEQEAEVDAAVDSVLAELNLWNKTDYEKIKGAYDWVTENVQYDFDNEDNDEYELCHSTYAAAVQRIAVCQGYATLYYRMMLELGIDCRYVNGMAGYVEVERHAWNIVRLEDKYYNMDPTWDRDLMGHYRMFLCTESNFTEHQPDNEYITAEWKANYPMAVVPYVFNVTASGKLSNGMEWVLDGDTGTLTVAGTGVIPSYRYSRAPWYDYRESVQSIVISEGITEVGERAFYWCTNCTSLTLPESLTAIREYGFNNLRALEYVTLPANLKTIEFCAFSECVALKEIVIPDSVTTCGSSAFSNCYGLAKAVIGKGLTSIPNSMFFGDKNLREVTLPEGVTYIGDTAFSDCGLFKFTIPKSLTGLGSSVFSGCRGLYKFTVESGNQYYKAVDGVLFTKDGKTLVAYTMGDITSYYYVPEGTEVIARSAFNDSYRLEHVYFPDSLKIIEPYAFAYCESLWSVTFTPNITRIGDSAFRSCVNLYSAMFKNPDVILESSVFANCDTMEDITLPANLKEIPNGLFYGSARLNEVTIPKTVTKIGSSAFLDCDSLTSVTIPGTVKTIEQQAFDFCDKLETVTIQEGVQKIGWLAFSRNPKLKKVVIPSSVTTIENKGSTDWTFIECPNVVLYVTCGTTGWNYARTKGLAHSDTHSYTSSKVVAPTCTAQGYTVYSCVCGASYNSNYKNALGHSYGTTVVPPTCTEQGYTKYTCTKCGSSYNANYVAATGIHTYKGLFCTVCGSEHPNAANYEGKVISILGDSISTFAGYIPTADGFNLEHKTRYPQDNLLTDVNETWWMQIISELNTKLGINDSWASTEVYNYIDGEVNETSDGTKACMASTTRIKNLGANGTPDVILFFGGTNDITQSRTLGTFNKETTPTNVDLVSVKWESVADAYITAIMRMQYYYPDTEIIAILPYYRNSQGNAKVDRYNDIFAAICNYYGVPYVDLRDCGITNANLPDGTHPDAAGMDYITEAVLEGLTQNCAIDAGENTVYSVTHNLENVQTDKHYYKGVSAGRTFEETITGEDISVTVTMGGKDITAEVYKDGKISIASVTGDIVITAKGKEKPIYADYIQELPEELCAGTNLWAALEPKNVYYTATGWGNTTNNVAWSVTFPILQGDKIYATSFEKNGNNGNTTSSTSGIRITFFDENGIIKHYTPAQTYAEFIANGYITVPEGATAVNVPMWNNSDENELYILNREHSLGEWYLHKAPTTSEAGEERRDCAYCNYYESREVAPFRYGDINRDGKVNTIDANYARRYAANLLTLDEVQKLAGDVNLDGEVNVIDSAIIRRYVVKEITSLPYTEGT